MSKRVKRTKDEGIVTMVLCQGSANYPFVSGLLSGTISGADGVGSPSDVDSLSLSGRRMTSKAAVDSDDKIFSVLPRKKPVVKRSDLSSEDVGVSDGSKVSGATAFGGGGGSVVAKSILKSGAIVPVGCLALLGTPIAKSTTGGTLHG